MPSLQDLAILHRHPRRTVMDADCRFCTDSAIIETAKAEMTSLRASDESLGAWLLEFFRYFGTEQLGCLRPCLSVDRLVGRAVLSGTEAA